MITHNFLYFSDTVGQILDGVKEKQGTKKILSVDKRKIENKEIMKLQYRENFNRLCIKYFFLGGMRRGAHWASM